MVERTLPQELSASDSLMWRIESDPVLRSPILVVGLLDRSPTPEGVEATIDRAVTTIPRLHQRIVGPPLDLGRPRWEDTGEPSLAHHVRRVRAPGGDLDSVLEVVQPDAATAFDPARSPWTMTIVDGLDDGRAAVVLRFHHAITDGMGAIEIADRLFDRSRRPAAAPRAAPGPATGTTGTTGTSGTGLAGPLGALVTGLTSTSRGVVEAVRHPTDALSAPLRFGRSVARLLAPAIEGSPELAGRSLDRWLAVTERPLGTLQRAGRATGGTINDVLLAAVAGALATYHRAQGTPVPSVRVTMPISIRREGDHLGGNRFVPARFTLPVDDPDPRARVKIAGAIVRRWRAEPALRSSGLIAAGLNMLPRPLVVRVFGGMLRSIDVDVVDVPGLTRPAFIGGARIDRLWAFAPPTGAALSITLVSHTRTGCVGLACDRMAVTDPELLGACLDDALDELISLGRTRASTSGRRRRSQA